MCRIHISHYDCIVKEGLNAENRMYLAVAQKQTVWQSKTHTASMTDAREGQKLLHLVIAKHYFDVPTHEIHLHHEHYTALRMMGHVLYLVFSVSNLHLMLGQKYKM